MNYENQVHGKRIREIREQQKLSREALAEKADISTQFLADIEGGKKGMSVVTLKKICNALHISADSIVFGNESTAKNLTLDAMLASISEEKQEEISKIMQMIIKLT
ncbi:MAG: helix-turn-helix transcriptional regulator [Clostridia bacterium]|nr:helix-turn-helix transcriptional regulator [Clostridia bacterium]